MGKKEDNEAPPVAMTTAREFPDLPDGPAPAGRALVEVEQEPRAAPLVPANWLDDIKGTLKPWEKSDKQRLFNLLQHADTDLKTALLNASKSHSPLTLYVAGWVCHPCQTLDEETGELTTWPRTVLLLADDTSVDCGSNGVARSMHQLELLEGASPWNPPLVLTIHPEPSKRDRKRTWYRVELVGRVAAES